MDLVRSRAFTTCLRNEQRDLRYKKHKKNPKDKEDKKHKKKHKKKKKRSKSKHGSREEESWDEGKRVAGCDEATMKQLRESRLRREAHEAHRTGSLLRHVPQGNGAGDVDKKRGYNGAFFLK